MFHLNNLEEYVNAITPQKYAVSGILVPMQMSTYVEPIFGVEGTKTA